MVGGSVANDCVRVTAGDGSYLDIPCKDMLYRLIAVGIEELGGVDTGHTAIGEGKPLAACVIGVIVSDISSDRAGEAVVVIPGVDEFFALAGKVAILVISEDKAVYVSYRVRIGIAITLVSGIRVSSRTSLSQDVADCIVSVVFRIRSLASGDIGDGCRSEAIKIVIGVRRVLLGSESLFPIQK